MSAIACALALAASQAPGLAQTGLFDNANTDANADSRMVLEADTLTFDRDRNTVTASGGVRIDYQGNRIVADNVTYDRNTQRLIATGNVEVVEEDGNIIHADEVDVTDDFRDGFVNALQVQTPEKTYFAAQSAEREKGEKTTFNSGVYTACEPCREKPEKAPVWRVKSRKIIWNHKEKTIRFRDARFEMFGLPIAYLPVFQVPDPSVKRQSGFLAPAIRYDTDIGFGVSVPYYFALAPTYDLTTTLTPYSKQGFLGEAEWRQRFDNGQYSLKIAGIIQNDPEAFRPRAGVEIVDSEVTNRAMVGSKGRFEINPRWTFGWDVLAQSDKNFSYTYEIGGYSDRLRHDEVYLTGLDDRNFFDLRAMRFRVQESVLDSSPAAQDEKQPWLLPSFDYHRTADEPVAGGELTLDINAQNLHRSELGAASLGRAFNQDRWIFDPDTGKRVTGTAIPGVEGNDGRITAETEWKRSFVTGGGLVLTPLLAARGDAIYTDFSDATLESTNRFGFPQNTYPTGITNFETNGNPIASDVRSAYWRYMVTAGVEARWPILFATQGSSHVIEPMAQVFVRPDAPYGDTLGIPNEDAQSLVFDATNLFERDKFSGYDRIESGTRANLGIRYSGAFGNGWTTHAVVGQSYQLAGDNPYAAPDLVNVGAYSGLETDVSDYVGLVGFSTPFGLSASAGARLDEDSLELRRSDVTADYSQGPVRLGLQYAFIQAQPLYGLPDDRREVTGRASLRFRKNWRVFGSSTYDLESSTPTMNSVGLGYLDECFGFAVTYSRRHNPANDEIDNSFGVRLSFRTIGDFGVGSNQFAE